MTNEQTHKATGSAHSHVVMSSINKGALMLPPQVAIHNYPSSDVPREPEPVEKRDTSLVLPDLNLMPSEDELCS